MKQSWNSSHFNVTVKRKRKKDLPKANKWSSIDRRYCYNELLDPDIIIKICAQYQCND